MRNDVKDVQFCTQGRHMAPREEMTQMLNDNGRSWRNVCETCKAETIEMRKKARSANGQ